MRAQSAVEETDVAAQRWRILRQHVEDGIALTVLAIHEDVSLRSLQRWHAAYRLDGLNGLIPRPRQPRARKTGAEMIALIEGLALLKPALSTTNIARRANEAATTRGWPTVSYGTARSIVTRLDPGMRMLALEGPAKRTKKPQGTSATGASPYAKSRTPSTSASPQSPEPWEDPTEIQRRASIPRSLDPEMNQLRLTAPTDLL